MANTAYSIQSLKVTGLVLAVTVSLWAPCQGAWAAQTEEPMKAQAGVEADAPNTTTPGVQETNGDEPQILARVNGAPVTRAEWERLLTSPFERALLLQELGVKDPDSKELDRLALRKLIRHRLLLQEAGRRSLTVTAQELDETITSLRGRFDDLTSFGAWMKEHGLDERSLFESIRAEILVAKVRGALVEGVSVTDEHLRQYYEGHEDDLKTEEVWLQVIAVKERAAAKKIHAALRKGEDFGRLAQHRSLGLRAPWGGDVGWVNAETLWPPMREAVATLKPGEAIGPLPKGEEFLIVRLHDRRLGRMKTLAEARPEIEQRLLPARQQDAIAAWLAEREEESEIEVLQGAGR